MRIFAFANCSIFKQQLYRRIIELKTIFFVEVANITEKNK